MSERTSSWRDRGLDLTVWALLAVLFAAFAWLTIDLLRTAWPRLGWDLLSEAPRRAGRAGGVVSILASTGLVLAVCWAVAAPLGLGAAWALAQARGRWAAWVRTSLDILAGLPSIVLGMFGAKVEWIFKVAAGVADDIGVTAAWRMELEVVAFDFSLLTLLIP